MSVAASLAEAVALLRVHDDVELLVSDYHLGADETGLQAIAAARAILGPRLGAVLVTGDTSSAVREIECDQHTRIASKPINADEFLGLPDGLRRLPAS